MLRSDLAPWGAATAKFLNDQRNLEETKKTTIDNAILHSLEYDCCPCRIVSGGAIEGNFLVRCIKGPNEEV